MSHSSEQIKKRYNRIAGLYDFFESPMEWMMAGHRSRLLSRARGKVLEVGVGTGKNLPWYPAGCTVTGIDFSPGMLARARKRAALLNGNFQLLEMDVQSLAFADNTFDTVVSSCVFCSVPDPLAGLRELGRVCKPGGHLLMLEHVRSQGPLAGPLMDWLNPLPLHIYGANINRPTLDNLRRAGFKTVSVQPIWRDILLDIEVTVEKGE